jgi:FkbH-like protein
LRSGIKGILRELDRRGILLSIASTNDEDLAMRILKNEAIADLFLHPQINWNNKVTNLAIIAGRLGIGLDAMGFVDDEPYELAQVRKLIPEVRAYNADAYMDLLQRPEFATKFRTREARRRRTMYIQESLRAHAQRESQLTRNEFLQWCNTQATFRSAREGDLPRILELLHRTHQLNATGRVYSRETIQSFLRHPRYRVFLAHLRDRFVDYGTIGVAICRCGPRKWTIVSFLLSCRVLGRGIGGVFLSWLQEEACRAGIGELEGLFIKRERNHQMYLLYTMSGFRPHRNGNATIQILSRKYSTRVKKPEWLTIQEKV